MKIFKTIEAAQSRRSAVNRCTINRVPLRYKLVIVKLHGGFSVVTLGEATANGWQIAYYGSLTKMVRAEASDASLDYAFQSV